MTRSVATVFGGSGFIGRHLIKRLVKNNFIVRVAVRDIESANSLRPIGDVGQIIPWPTNILDIKSVATAIERASVVINCVGILYETANQTFENIHKRGAENIAQASNAFGVKKLIHVSALGADENSKSVYARTKIEGEIKTLNNFENATIVRPSVVFGPEDKFFNLFASISRFSLAMPIIGSPFFPIVRFTAENGLDINLYGDGGPKFQPVYVGDVADAIMSIINHPKSDGQIYELTGPTIYCFKEIIELILTVTKRKRLLIPLSLFAANLIASIVGILPRPLLTRDQIKLLHHDNIATGDHHGLAELGIQPHTVEAIIPTYLLRFRPAAQRIKLKP